MAIDPYLFFNGRCEEALEFYRQTLGAEPGMKMRFSESPDAPPPGMVAPDWGHKIMHSELRIGGALVMASDGMGPAPLSFQGFSLTLHQPDEAAARRVFDALAANGGKVEMPLGKTFFSPCFGAVADRFGVSWMVIVQE
jgi:PhnB protein